MARRTMTLRRIDPWSVLKFGFVVNVCIAVVVVLAAALVWFVITQLGIIEQACQLAEDVGFEDCGVDGGALFRLVVLFAGLAAIIMTGIVVFGAFLHNLLADLVGGIQVTLSEAGGPPRVARRRPDERARGTAGRTEDETVRAGAADEPRWTLGSPPPREPTSESERAWRRTGDEAEEDVIFGTPEGQERS